MFLTFLAVIYTSFVINFGERTSDQAFNIVLRTNLLGCNKRAGVICLVDVMKLHSSRDRSPV